MSLFSSKRSSPFPEPIVNPFPGGGSWLGPQTPEQAMRLSAVWACVRILAESVSMMPVSAFQRMPDGLRRPVTNQPAFLKNPAAFGTTQDWIYQVMVSLLLKGNAWGQIVSRDNNNIPTQVEILHPDRVHMAPNLDRTKWVIKLDGKEVDPDSMWHVAAFLMPGSPVGLSPIAYAARTLGTVASAEKFGQGFFDDGGHPSAVLESDQIINQDQATTIKTRFLSATKDNREPAVLGAGVKYRQIQVSPEESQFLDTQKFGIGQIARIFGVPPEMIGSEAGNSMTYSNVTQRAMDFLTYSVQPWLTRLEGGIDPLLAKNQHARFDTSVLVRLDARTKWEVNQAKLNTGAETINKIRAEDNQTPVEWGDEPWLPGVKTSAAAAALKATLTPASDPEEPDANEQGEPDNGNAQ